MINRAIRRRPLVSGNWKMHHDHLVAVRTVADLGLRIDPASAADVEVTVHPPFTDLRSVQTVVEDRGIPVQLGAQHCHFADEGAFTGEVSPAMLARLGVRYVIAGHSERRQLFGQSDEVVAQTVRAVLRHGMVPIVCVGESEQERADGVTEARLTSQVSAVFTAMAPDEAATCVVAYEPIWAIGTGATATAEDAQRACRHIRQVVTSLAGAEAAGALRVQYGGSVKPDNTADLLAQPDVDGALVGGASLQADTFAAIVEAAHATGRAGR